MVSGFSRMEHFIKEILNIINQIIQDAGFIKTVINFKENMSKQLYQIKILMIPK